MVIKKYTTSEFVVCLDAFCENAPLTSNTNISLIPGPVAVYDPLKGILKTLEIEEFIPSGFVQS